MLHSQLEKSLRSLDATPSPPHNVTVIDCLSGVHLCDGGGALVTGSAGHTAITGSVLEPHRKRYQPRELLPLMFPLQVRQEARTSCTSAQIEEHGQGSNFMDWNHVYRLVTGRQRQRQTHTRISKHQQTVRS